MRKLVKLMTIGSLATLTSLQVIACKDDSKFQTFMSDVSNSANDHTAFFGFLGSADDEVSSALQASFDLLNKKEADGITKWQTWVDDHDSMLKNPKLMLENISLRYYQGPYHQNKPSDIVESFWNDKGISWQRDIFNWVYTRTQTDPDFNVPKGSVSEVHEISTKKDGSDRDMFTKLPIVFIVSKGKLITAGEGWIGANSSWDEQEKNIIQFILDNLLLV